LRLALKNIQPTNFPFHTAPNSIWGNDLEWETGKIYQIVAASGSGKTTLVSILSGLRGDYNGSVICNHQKFSEFSYREWSHWRSDIASFVFQDLRLFPNLTAFENILITTELSTRHLLNQSKVNELASSLGLDETKLMSFVKHISLGQSQRIAIIRAIIRTYKWLILDEPFSHLDQENAYRAWELIKEDAANKNAGIIITSLDPYPFIKPHNLYHL